MSEQLYKKILLPTDGSKYSDISEKHALSIALRDECGVDVKITTMVKEGSPARVILETIEEEDIDLVVIGSSGKTGIDKFLMGSVAEKVVKSAKCSVLVVH